MSENDKNLSETWLTLDEAAAHVGLGKTVFYEMSRDGRVPANRVGKKWLFEKTQLDLWIKSNKPIGLFLTSLDANIDSNLSLRESQREAYARTVDFFRSGKNKAILQIPVGCGKTGLAAILPLGVAQGRALIIAPNLTIKTGLYEAMDITNRQKCFWRKASVLNATQMTLGPLACTLDSGNITVAEKCHVVITNIQQLATNVDKWLKLFSHDFFDMIIVDEAHHSAADSWKKVLLHFPEAKIIHMTATPFRSDGQDIDGTLVYRYSFRSATIKGYIKRIKASYIAPSEIELSFADDRGRTYSLDEVMKLKEEDWFSRGVALAPLCNKHIADASLAKLEELRQSGTKHQLIAVACSINHAKEIRSLYAERGYSAEIIHSNQKPEEQERVLSSLKNNSLDCIIQVQMLGEGFDHPHLSVAAIFRPFRSLAPYVQFVGRVLRVIVQNDPTHPDNLGHVVTHLGMNLDQRLSEFKLFEKDDEAFWKKVIGGADPELPAAARNGDARLSTRETKMVVHGEIVDSLWEDEFTSIEDQQKIDHLREQMKLLGLDPSQAEEMVKKSKAAEIVKTAAAGSFPIQPQRALEEARKRVKEQADRISKIVLNHAELQMDGREIPYKYKSLGASGRTNFVASVMMVNHEINKRLGKEREQCSLEDFKRLLDQIEDILQTIARRVRRAKSEYEKQQT